MPVGMPEHIEPMLCTLVKEPIDNAAYLYEMKWDGYRIIARVEDGVVRLNSRSGLDYTARYPLVAEALLDLKVDLIIDGEVVVFNEDGKPDFDALQLYNGHDNPIIYCVFDLLWLNGTDVTGLPLYQRRDLLLKLIRPNKVLRFSETFDSGKELYKRVLEQNMEGIVAKDRSSPYMPGKRGTAWLKIPTRKQQEFVIGGWAESEKSRSFRSLLFGAYEKNKLQWIGRSGGGYKQAEMPGILKKLEALEIDHSPFENEVLDSKGARIHWVKPELVANFEFATWTKSGRIRKPATFLGFRFDKDAKDVMLEVPLEAEEIEKQWEQEHVEQEHHVPENVEQVEEPGLLEKYYHKRDLNITPEPGGGKPKTDALIFVVQKHNASHLHYDLRLEMRGVLKSWAVPKGPSMRTEDHRLAMEVEDHPYDYKDFEGIIPEGEYGAGTVIVWDQGTYEPAEQISGKQEQERWLLSHYHKNSLSFILHGKKLKGKFNLVKTKGKGENSWLLTKAKDGEELDSDITLRDVSVVSGKTILEVALSKQPKVWKSNRNADPVLEMKLAKKQETIGDMFPNSANASEGSNWKKIFSEQIKSEGAIEVAGKKLVLTNIEKKLWKQVNKASLIQYYNSISEFILPYLADRPLSLYIKNVSAAAPGFYIKDMEGFAPDFVAIFSTSRKHKAEGKRDVIDYAVCNNLPALIWLVNLGCVDFNPWNSRVSNQQKPDYITVDLDPSDEDFKKAVRTALAAKEFFDDQGLKTFIKTSGKTGIHIFIPCSAFTFSKARLLAKHICGKIQERVPKISTLEISKEQRGNRLLVDFSQNDVADTVASAYSVRPGKQPAVSTPLEWEELSLKIKPEDFTIETTMARLQEKGDLWEKLLDTKIQQTNDRLLQQLLSPV